MNLILHRHKVDGKEEGKHEAEITSYLAVLFRSATAFSALVHWTACPRSRGSAAVKFKMAATMTEKSLDLEVHDTGSLLRDAKGNILVNQNGFVTCTTEGGLQLEIKYKDIDFSNDNLLATFEDKQIIIKLKADYESQKENDSVLKEVHLPETFTWTDASTKFFIELYKEKKELLTNRKIKTKKILWEIMREGMETKGFVVTTTQLENKLKSLERSYKNMVTNNKQTGRGRMTCPYQTELTDLLGHKHNIEPIAVSGRNGLIRKNPTSTFQIEEIDKEDQTTIEDIQEGQSSTINKDIIAIDENQGQSSRSNTSVLLTQRIENINSKLSQKQRKPGGTERMLQKCEKRFEKLTEEIISENKMKIERHKAIMAEYTEIRRIYEEIATTMKEGFATANRHREERNKLLQTLIKQQQQNRHRE